MKDGVHHPALLSTGKSALLFVRSDDVPAGFGIAADKRVHKHGDDCPEKRAMSARELFGRDGEALRLSGNARQVSSVPELREAYLSGRVLALLRLPRSSKRRLVSIYATLQVLNVGTLAEHMNGYTRTRR